VRNIGLIDSVQEHVEVVSRDRMRIVLHVAGRRVELRLAPGEGLVDLHGVKLTTGDTDDVADAAEVSLDRLTAFQVRVFDSVLAEREQFLIGESSSVFAAAKATTSLNDLSAARLA